MAVPIGKNESSLILLKIYKSLVLVSTGKHRDIFVSTDSIPELLTILLCGLVKHCSSHRKKMKVF